MLNYILQIIFYQLLFLGIYEAFLKKETFFQWNRFYLILTVLLSYIIPFIQIKGFEKLILNQKIVSNNFTEKLSQVIISSSLETDIYKNFYIWNSLYYLGSSLMLFLFVYKLFELIKIVYNSQVISRQNYKLVIVKNNKKAFSFLYYIFLGKEIYKKEHNHILKHELIHVKEKHTFDLLFFEIQKILFWFNPLIYIYQYKISVLHEYIADEKTIKNTEKRSFYKNLLLQTFNIEKIPFINQYSNKSLLKKRIIMATKNKSRQISKLKYLLLVPVIISMLAVASCENKENLKPQYEEEAFSFIQIKKPPVFPGCENIIEADEIKQCFSKNINQFIADNFNKELSKELNLPPGKKRILLKFIINKNGDITDIVCRAPHPKLKEEAIRIIKALPKMQAGLAKSGKKVNVRYNLPIIFNVEEDTDSFKKIINKKLQSPPVPPKPIK
jgi:beta-lactamase regulating signal transducer with metallopeptidase domain